MTPFLRKLLGLNWLLLIVMLALAVFGVVAIYSATYMREDPVATDFWRKQANWVAVGFFAFMVASLVNYHWIRWGALPMYLAGIIFLVLTKFMGQKVYGARSWLHLGPVNFQPAQLAVVAGIMVLALFLSQFKQMHPMLRLLVCGAVAGAPCLLILMQPDLGEVIIWVPVLLALLFVGGMPLRYLLCILLILFAMIPITANLVLNPYQQARLTAFAHHRCAIAAHQLQRLIRAHDHVRARCREQRLGESARSRAIIFSRRKIDILSRAIYFERAPSTIR